MGWTGKLLKVDLTGKTFSTEAIESRTLQAYLGGRGLGAYLLRASGMHIGDPFDPRMPVIFAAGPLTGSRAPSSWRSSLTSISPLTSTIFDSNSGGRGAQKLKQCGFDALMIVGQAASPTLLVIDSTGVKFLSAERLWGLGNELSRKFLHDEYGKNSAVMTIGPAGENLSLMANICHNGRFFGRGGLGALFGNKKLKAVVIGRGDAETFTAADAQGFGFVTAECNKLLAAQPITARGLSQFGTPVLMNVMNTAEVLPVENFRKGRFAGANKISGEALRDTLTVGRHGCPGCRIACGRLVEVDSERFAGPEFETLWSFGADLGIDDLKVVAKLNRLANDLGLDTVSTGSTIAAARELYEKGSLEFDPLAEGFEGLAKLLGQIAVGEGPGAQLMHGSKKLGELVGTPEVSMTVKGMELPAYDPRGAQGQGLSYATSNRGGCHLRSYMIAPEILATPKLIDRFATSGKAGLVIVSQNLNAAVDSLVMCRFTSFALKDDYYARLVRCATGMEIDAQGLMGVGERIYNLERLINIERGFGRKDDTLPRRLLEQSVDTGPAAGRTVDLTPMLDEYYRFRGWDTAGVPTREKMDGLGLTGPDWKGFGDA